MKISFSNWRNFIIAYRIPKLFAFLILFFFSKLSAEEMGKPIAILTNPCPQYSLINSVAFHPTQNLFCATYTHGQEIIFYEIDNSMPRMVHSLKNPLAKLDHPQHAVFASRGDKVIVANWSNQTLALYKIGALTPDVMIPSPNSLKSHKPHGIALSPCGHFLAIAYGAASYYDRAIALYRVKQDDCVLLSMLEELPGTPKGITFSPDGTCLLVTFSDINSLVVYKLDAAKIIQKPLQSIQGTETGISRPEDVKISPDGRYCAVTNSDCHTVTFYPFDRVLNQITQKSPCLILQNPEALLCMPHGIAFSPDGSYLVVSQFGNVSTSEEGDVVWDDNTLPDHARINVYKNFLP